MAEDESYIVKRRDEMDIDQMILHENKDALAEFLDEPLSAIAEAITGALASGPKSWAVSSGKIVQAALKGKMFQQFSRELKELREKGKIPDDFADKPYGYQSWSELMTVIDSETPDPERLDAIKAMFYAVNKITASDGERILAYQLFQIAKKLTSGQLLYLKACHDIYKTRDFQQSRQTTMVEWLTKVGNRLGHNVHSLLNLDDLALVEMGLLTERRGPDRSAIMEGNAHLTDLALTFCEEIQKYHLETRGVS